MKGYLKRLFKYVFWDYKQPKIYAKILEKPEDKVLEEKKYIVTGGSSGLGFYIAKSLLKSGAKVIITGRDEDKLKKAKSLLGDNCDYYTLDVKNIEKDEEFISYCFDKYGYIDGLINNAGISLHEKNILDVSTESFSNQFDTNLKAPYFLSKFYILCVKNKKQKEANIIFISSERGSMADDIPYGLTKNSLNALTMGLSRRFYKEGIRVNAIAPGVTASDLTKIDKNSDLYLDKASGRALVPEEIAEVVKFILSDYSKCISGEIINCDAGNHISSYF